MKPTKRKFSNIKLYKAQSLDNTYKRVIDWQTGRDLDNWLDKHPHVEMNNSAYQNISKTIRWDSKILSFNELQNYNYLRIENHDEFTDSVMCYYAFVTDYLYVNDGVTQISFSLDVWNTYKWNVGFGKAMIERGFVKEFKDDKTDWTDLYNRVRHNSEPIGGDGCTKLRTDGEVLFNHIAETPDGENGTYADTNRVRFLVFTTEPKDVKTDKGTFIGDYSQYNYHIVPYNIHTGKTIRVLKPDGVAIYDNEEPIEDCFNAICDDESFAGSASLVIDAEVYDYIGFDYDCLIDRSNNVVSIRLKKNGKFAKGANGHTLRVKEFNSFKPQNGYVRKMNTGDYKLEGDNLYKAFSNWLKQILDYDSVYKDLIGVDIPYKILANPWTSLYFTDGRGTKGQFDINMMNHLKDKTFVLKRFGGIQTNGKQAYALLHYNRSNIGDNTSQITGYENGLMIDQSQRDVPVILDNYAMFMNSNRNQLQANAKNAEMARDLQYMGAETAKGNALRSANAQAYIAKNDVKAQAGILSNNLTYMDQNSGYNGMAKTVGGIAQGFANGGPKGALIGGALGVGSGAFDYMMTQRNIDLQQNNFAISQDTTVKNRNILTNLQKDNALDNYAYQNQIGTNNYEMTMNSQQAMLADVARHNDVSAHQGTGALWDQQNECNSLHAQLFTCQTSVLYSVCQYFLLFGYSIQRFEPIDNYLFIKNEFNYVKASNVNCLGEVPTPVLNSFEAIFENGVSVWRPTPKALEHFETNETRYNTFV